MSRPRQHNELVETTLLRFGAGIIAVLVAFIVRYAFARHFGPALTYTTFYPAVMLAALLGGLAAGLLATGLAAILALVWILPPLGAFQSRSVDALGLALFVSTGVFMSIAGAVYRRTRERAAEYEKQLAISRSQEQYRELVQNANSAIIRWKRDGKIAFFNEYAQRFFGYSEQEALGKPVTMLMPETESTGADLTTLASDILNRPELFANNVNENVRRDGTRVWMTWTNKPIVDEQGKVVEVLAIGSDITARKKAEQALEITTRRSELLSETAGRLLLSETPQAELQSLCEKVMRELDCHVFFNYLANDLHDRLHLNAFYGVPEKEGREIEWLDYGVAVCGCVAQQGCRIVAENIPDVPDPRTNLVKSYGVQAYACHPLLAEGNRVIGTLSFGSRTKRSFNDDELSLMKAVTDQVATAMTRMRLLRETQDNEQKSKAILDATTESMWMFDTEGRVILANATAAQRLNKPIAEVIGRTMHELLPKRLADSRMRRLREVVAANAPVRFEDERAEMIFDHSFYPVRDGAGAVTGVVSFSHDITAQKTAEDERSSALRQLDARASELQNINEELEVTNEELRLATQDLNAEIAERKRVEQALLDGEAQRQDFYRRTILAATDGKLLISDPEEITRIAGRSSATWTVRKLADVATVRDDVFRMVQEAGMSDTGVHAFIGCVVEAVGNAFKHAGGGKASLHKLGDSFMLVVSDTGPGIGTMALPDVALKRGYSTKGTLGMGYKVMAHFAHRVYLATGPEGTMVAIEMKLGKDPAPEIPIGTFSDSWAS